MTLKFTRNVLVYGEHREAGTIHEIKDSDAVSLIAGGAAVKFTAPEIPVRESATLQSPIKTASLPPATKKQR